MDVSTIGSFHAKIDAQIDSGSMGNGGVRLKKIVQTAFEGYEPGKQLDSLTESRILQTIAAKVDDVPTLRDPQARSFQAPHLSGAEKAQAFTILQNLGCRVSATAQRFEPFMSSSKTVGDLQAEMQSSFNAAFASQPNSGSFFMAKLNLALSKIPSDTRLTGSVLNEILKDLVQSVHATGHSGAEELARRAISTSILGVVKS